jgi:signal transduction histidine kinase
VPIALEALEVSTQAQLARVGLLQPGEALRLRLGEAFAPGDPADAVSPSGEVPLFARFESKALAQQLEQLEEARRLKQLLLVVCAALALGLALGAVQQQRARQRFLQARADFLAAVSHELKTPLAAVRVMAETLALRLEGTAAAKDYPQRIVQEADGLSALVENLLSFERIDKGRWVLQRRKVEVAGWAAALHDEVARAGKAVHLQLEGFEGLTAELDGALVQLLLVNLVRNACRYTARTPAEVRVSAAREGQEVVFRVRDNGVGIPPEAQRRIFEPFVRLEPAASSGSGLGLALALRIAQLHGGTLAVEASSHEGSTFVARLVG